MEADPPHRAKTCVVPPPGLQALLMASGLIRHLASTRHVVVATETAHLKTLPRLFQGADVRFWFGAGDAAARAGSRGYEVMVLPPEPLAMYACAGLDASEMHTRCELWRDLLQEQKLVDSVVAAHGPSFVLTWGTPDSDAVPTRGLLGKFLPFGVPVVDAATLVVAEPCDFCSLMEQAMQVHAVDSWFLTLADLVGGTSRKFCHAYATPSSSLVCRKKYRRRVTVICRARVDLA